MTIEEIIKVINQSNEIAVSFHMNPDGDALGSSLALTIALMAMGKRTYLAARDSVPEVYNFLPFNNGNIDWQEDILPSTDCLIALDCGNIERLSTKVDTNSRAYTILNLDHHVSNDYYGDYNLVDTEAAAVGEIIYKLLLGMKSSINNDIAVCLYTSLLTDTGSFKHSNTTATTHYIAGELIKTGIDFTNIHRQIFENKKFETVKLYGKVINSMELLHDGQICIMELTNKIIESCGCEISDTSDIIALGVGIDTVEVTVLLKETESGVKASLRSKNQVDVRKIAEAFGGGGHVRAAGLSMSTDLKKAREIIINSIEKELMI